MVARRLSPVVAFRYHALPVAEDGERITVAMADPNDAVAREAVEAALGARSCIVQSKAAHIDELLSQLWPDPAENGRQVLVCAPAGPRATKLSAYADYVCRLIHAEASHWEHPGDLDAWAAETVRRRYDLVILSPSDQSFIERLISGPVERRAVDRLPTSLLIARKPRWPIQRILLLLNQDGSADAAVDWVVRLAQSAGARATVLAVVPPVPAMYQGLSRMKQDLSTLLGTDTALGRQMRQVARRLVDENVDARLRLRQGQANWEGQHAILEEKCDLIVTAAEASGRWRRPLEADVVSSLLRRVDRPILIARSADSDQYSVNSEQ